MQFFEFQNTVEYKVIEGIIDIENASVKAGASININESKKSATALRELLMPEQLIVYN